MKRFYGVRLACYACVVLLAGFTQWFVVNRTEVIHPIRADAAKYVGYAYNLKHHHVFAYAHDWDAEQIGDPPPPDKLTLPGYPAFLTLFLGDEPKPDYDAFVLRVVGAQMILGIGTCVLTLLLAAQLLPFRWAITAGVLTAISPHMATISTYVLTESLFAFLVAGSLYLLVLACKPMARWPVFAAAGCVIGLSSLVRHQLTPVPFLLLGLPLMSPSWRARWLPLLVGFLVFASLLVPWQLRNARVTDSGPSLAVSSVYHGSFPWMMYHGDPLSYGAPYRFDPAADAHSRNFPALLEFVGAEFRRSPAEMIHWYLIGKPEFFLSWNEVGGSGDVFIYPVASSPYLDSPGFRALHAVSYSLHWPITLLALLGMFICWLRPSLLTDSQVRQDQFRLLASVLAAMLLMHIVVAPFPRYSIPFRPLVYVLGLIAVHGLKARMERTRFPAIPSQP